MPRVRLTNQLDSDRSEWKKIQLEPVDEVVESPVFYSDDEGQHSRSTINYTLDGMIATRRPKTITALKARIERHQRRRIVLDEDKEKSDTTKGALAHSLSARDSQQPRIKTKHKSRKSSSANRKRNLGSSEIPDSTAKEYSSLINPDVTYRRKQNDAQKGRSRSWSRSWTWGWNQAAWLRDELLTQRPRKYHSLSRDSRRVFRLTDSFAEAERTKKQQLTEFRQTSTRKVSTQDVGSSSAEVKTEPEVWESQNPKFSTERFRDFLSNTANIYSPIDDTQDSQPEDGAHNSRVANQQVRSEQPNRLYSRNPKINAPPTPCQYQLKRNYGYF